MDEHSRTGLPASIEAAWGVRDRPPKGPKPGLSLDRIVDAAVRVAQAEGLAAVSMSRVATELGAATMSLYRYVAAKDELLMLMVDAAVGPPPPDVPMPDGDWRAGVAGWMRAYFGLLRRHHWVVRVPISGPPLTPNSVAWFELGLHALRETGLAADEKVGVILLISGFVRSEAMLNADLTEAILASGGEAAPIWTSYGQLLMKLTDAERFPALHEIIAAGVLDNEAQEQDEDEQFDFGLQRVLDGIEALVRARSAP